MATKKCVNGHLYDPSIYGDKCPFCPSSEGSTKVNAEYQEEYGTRILGGAAEESVRPTETINIGESEAIGGGTVIRHINVGTEADNKSDKSRLLVGLLVSYSAEPNGEVYKIYEGRNTIGRDMSCDISFPNDSHMSSKHLLIQYVEAKGAFRAQEYDKGSVNGSYVNGKVYVLGDIIDLKDRDVIVIGGTKFIFLAIPEF